MSAQELARVAEVVAGYFAPQAEEIVAVYLFGSIARGEAHRDSDVDVGVVYRRPPPATLMGQPFGAAADLTEKLGLPVDLVVMNGAPVDLLHRILRDGRIVLEHDRGARIAFEVQARNHYFDLLPVLRTYRRGSARP